MENLQYYMRKWTGNINLDVCCVCGSSWLYDNYTWLCGYHRYGQTSTAIITKINNKEYNFKEVDSFYW